MITEVTAVVNLGTVITGKGDDFWMPVINALFLVLGGSFMGMFIFVKIHYKFPKPHIYYLDSVLYTSYTSIKKFTLGAPGWLIPPR